MLFNQYTHMDNDYKILKCDLVQDILSNKSFEFVATEKIHGTNFSFISDGNIVKCCRRSDILGPDEKFYSYQTILDKYNYNVIKLFEKTAKLIKTKYNKEIIQIQLYGELYGGSYPGLDTKYGSKIVQKGIYYSDSNEFAAFDLKYWTTLDNKEKPQYLDWDVFVFLLNDTLIPIVPVISQGSWENISNLDPKFESVVYLMHYLPKIPSNYAEGYVIKPVKEIRFGIDSDRLIWKFKNPNFSEVSNSKSAKSNEKNNKQVNPLVSRLETYICETRYDNVRAKVVENTPVDKVVELFYNDIWVDFTDDLVLDSINLNDVDKKELEKKLKGFANKFVRTRYQAK